MDAWGDQESAKLVDHEPSIQDLLRDALEEKGHEVLTASVVEDAMAMLDRLAGEIGA